MFIYNPTNRFVSTSGSCLRFDNRPDCSILGNCIQHNGSFHSTGRRQRGVVLVVSLVLLAAMTIMGVATMSGTSLNERITSNAQQKSVAFEVAESAIASVWDKTYLNTALVVGAGGAGNNPVAVEAPDADTGLASDFDMQNSSGKTVVDADGVLTVQYCGEGAPIGSDLNADESATAFAFKLFNVNSVVQIANSGARADHVQRGAVIAAKTNRTGACPAR